jgi:hypothetical protein
MIFPVLEGNFSDFVPFDWVQVITKNSVFYCRYRPSTKNHLNRAIERNLKESEMKLSLSRTDFPFDCLIRKWQIKLPNCLHVKIRVRDDSHKRMHFAIDYLSLLMIGYLVRDGCKVTLPDGQMVEILETKAQDSKSPDAIITKNTRIHIELQPRKQEIISNDGHSDELYQLINVLFFYKKTVKKLGIDIPKGLILYGESGVGKTLMVNQIATQHNIKLVEYF